MKTSERIYIIPKWAAVVFAAAVLAIFVLGYFTHGFGGLPQTLVISFVVVGIVALIQTNDNVRGVFLVSCHSQPVPAGEEVIVEATFRNSSARERLGLRVRLRDGWRLKGNGWVGVLRPGGTVTIRIRVPASRRGCYPHPQLWLSSDLPFGLCFAWKVFAGGGEYVVYPKPLGNPLATIFSGVGGGGQELRKGADDISGHRSYAAGDLLSRLDWRVFAKSGKLLVKTFDSVDGRRIALRWEDTAFLQDPEIRLEQLSFWISECVRNRQPFELLLGSAPRHLNETNPTACRAALAAFQP